jgi:hypothetical protein
MSAFLIFFGFCCLLAAIVVWANGIAAQPKPPAKRGKGGPVG